MTAPRIAIVHDWLVTLGGGERVLEALVTLFPSADLYTLVHDPRPFRGTALDRPVFTSALQRLPLAKHRHRWFIGLMPWAVERLNVSDYDLVLSSSSAVAHGVRPQQGARHINYIHAPMRYAWDPESHLGYWGLSRGPASAAARYLLRSLRAWDKKASKRVDMFLANSRFTADNVQRCYGREAEVVYPPVRTDFFKPAEERQDYYITVSRLVPHKRTELIVEAFNRMGKPLVVVGDGPSRRKLEKMAGQNVRLVVNATDREVAQLLGRARAFAFAGVEEFGISMVEAQAAGCPVIAYGSGGALETVIDGQTGVLYGEQSVEGLLAGVAEFKRIERQLSLRGIRTQAELFGVEVFRSRFMELVEDNSILET